MIGNLEQIMTSDPNSILERGEELAIQLYDADHLKKIFAKSPNGLNKIQVISGINMFGGDDYSLKERIAALNYLICENILRCEDGSYFCNGLVVETGVKTGEEVADEILEDGCLELLFENTDRLGTKEFLKGANDLMLREYALWQQRDALVYLLERGILIKDENRLYLKSKNS
jgi:hypothetical protein